MYQPGTCNVPNVCAKSFKYCKADWDKCKLVFPFCLARGKEFAVITKLESSFQGSAFSVSAVQVEGGVLSLLSTNSSLCDSITESLLLF